MRIWFDTEFIENGQTIDLISIGMVREDGATIYHECADCDLSRASDWVRKNVFPTLKGPFVSKGYIARMVKDFAGEKPEFWAYYADYDWVALCQLYGTMMDLPKGWPMFCLDIQQQAYLLGKTPPKQTEGHHNALSDALWNKEAWEFLNGETPEARTLARRNIDAER